MVAEAGMKLMVLKASKFCHGGWSWNEAECVDMLLAFLASQDVSSLMVTGAGMKLMVMICYWHSWFDSK
jgi:hypothetical protein